MPSPSFIRSIAANIAYWQQATQNLTDETLPTIEQDRQNLYRAIEFGAQLEETWRETAVLALQCYPLIERRGYWHEWIPLLERLRQAPGGDDLIVIGRLLNQLGIFYRYNHQLEKSLAAHWQEIELGRLMADDWRLAHAHINLAATNRELHQYDEAEQHAIAARDHFRIIKAAPIKFAFVAKEMGLIAQARGQWDKAEAQQRQAIALWREINQPILLVESLRLLGQVLWKQTRLDEALAIYQEALALLEATDSELNKSRVFIDIGALYYDKGDWEKAEAYFLQADSPTMRYSGNLFAQAQLKGNLGNVYLMNGRLDKATSCLQQAITFWQQTDDHLRLANALGTLAEVHVAQGEAASAVPLLHQALTLLADYPDDAWSQRLQTNFGRILAEIS
ncbi:MAG: tetratricopeptide repeat protein [Ardenticatenaceae bacterium]|nr:tetratricopeptide repeat protein [Ardenticatenaceae bacterium]